LRSSNAWCLADRRPDLPPIPQTVVALAEEISALRLDHQDSWWHERFPQKQQEQPVSFYHDFQILDGLLGINLLQRSLDRVPKLPAMRITVGPGPAQRNPPNRMVIDPLHTPDPTSDGLQRFGETPVNIAKADPA
jgi:hypothetical protein